MKASEVRALSTEEISKQVETARQQLSELRFKLATKQLTNHREIRRLKRDIARLLTTTRERELSAE